MLQKTTKPQNFVAFCVTYLDSYSRKEKKNLERLCGREAPTSVVVVQLEDEGQPGKPPKNGRPALRRDREVRCRPRRRGEYRPKQGVEPPEWPGAVSEMDA